MSLGKNQEESQQFQENLKNILELMQEYRLLTVNLIEYILRWREYIATPLLISGKTEKKEIKNIMTIPFFYQNENYLLKV